MLQAEHLRHYSDALLRLSREAKEPKVSARLQVRLAQKSKRNIRIRTKSDRPKGNPIQEPHPCPSIDPRSPPLFSAS
jgi:hypothetical protein